MLRQLAASGARAGRAASGARAFASEPFTATLFPGARARACARCDATRCAARRRALQARPEADRPAMFGRMPPVGGRGTSVFLPGAAECRHVVPRRENRAQPWRSGRSASLPMASRAPFCLPHSSAANASRAQHRLVSLAPSWRVVRGQASIEPRPACSHDSAPLLLRSCIAAWAPAASAARLGGSPDACTQATASAPRSPKP